MKTAAHENSFVVTCEDAIVSLFAGCPELCGFTVKFDGDVILSDIGLFPEPGAEDLRIICAEIRETLLTLVDERPEARRLLSGRTFARALH